MIRSRIPDGETDHGRRCNWNFAVFMEVLMTGRPFPPSDVHADVPDSYFFWAKEIGVAMRTYFDADRSPAEAARGLIETHFTKH